MPVPVVQVRIVRVPVGERFVGMGVGMRLLDRRARIMRMPMVLVVPVRMAVQEPLVGVLVLMPLGEVQPHPGPHERGPDTQLPAQCLMYSR